MLSWPSSGPPPGVVADYSQPIQRTLFTTLFAVPRDDAPTCASWVADLLQHRDPPRRLRAVRAIKDYLTQRIDDRIANPAHPGGTGLLDALADAQLDDRPLSGEKMLDIAFLMVMASLDTLANSLSFSFHYLAQHTDHQHQLAADPASSVRAAEELLRLHSVVNIARTATRDTTLADAHIAADDRVLLCLSLAGRDPDTYPHPTTADLARPATPGHLAFGAGPHRCLGARIATDALTAALREWHRSIPAYTIPAEADIQTGGGAVCSLDALPLTWPIRHRSDGHADPTG
ncbi:cytochrome P450 [Amycolatopsis lurida]